MSSNKSNKPDHDTPMARVMSLREGDIIMKSGTRLKKNEVAKLSKEEVDGLVLMIGEEFVKRID